MKQKKIGKKLSLNKKTIADLNLKEMKDVYGGFNNSMRITACTCKTCSAPGACC
jgi:natural product precursor